MKAKHIVIRVILLVLISLLSLALTAVGVFAVLGWNMHSEAIEARPVRQVYADASADGKANTEPNGTTTEQTDE